MSQELTDAELREIASEMRSWANAGHKMLDEWAGRIERSIAARLERPAVEGDWTLEPPKTPGWYFYCPRKVGYGYPAELLKVNKDDEFGLTCWRPGMPSAQTLDGWLAGFGGETVAFSTVPFNEPERPLPWRK